MQYIFTYSSKRRSSLDQFSLKLCMCLHILNSIQESATAPHWSNRSIAGSYIRSNEIKRLLDNQNICRQFFIVNIVDNVD